MRDQLSKTVGIKDLNEESIKRLVNLCINSKFVKEYIIENNIDKEVAKQFFNEKISELLLLENKPIGYVEITKDNLIIFNNIELFFIFNHDNKTITMYLNCDEKNIIVIKNKNNLDNILNVCIEYI